MEVAGYGVPVVNRLVLGAQIVGIVALLVARGIAKAKLAARRRDGEAGLS